MLSEKEIIIEEISKLLFRQIGAAGNEKIIAKGFAEEGYHHTFHFGFKSKCVDIHLTNESLPEKHPDRYKRLFAITHYSIARLFVSMRRHISFALKKYCSGHTLNLGKLNRYNSLLLPLSPNNNFKEHFYELNEKKKKFRFKGVMPFDILDKMLIEPNNVPNDTSDTYMVLIFKKGTWRKIGIAYKNKEKPQSRRLYFVSNKNFNMYFTRINIAYFLVLSRIDFYNKEMIMNTLWENLQENYSKTSIFKKFFVTTPS